MEQKKSGLARKAWYLLRLALLWARKGGVFKRVVMTRMDLTKYFKTLRLRLPNTERLHYGDRELSFDDTPIIRFTMHRPTSLPFKLPRIPCINPQVDFDYDFKNYDDDRVVYYSDVERKSFLKGGDDEEDYEFEVVCEEMIPKEDEGIDLKAEEFIAKFYQQIKLQRQISDLQYNETAK